jgi:uncharacterized protein (DUF1778 family)
MAKQDRIDFRIDENLKTEFAHSAEVLGMNLSTFMISAARQLSSRARRMEQLPPLSDRDRDVFLAALDRPAREIPESNKKAKTNYSKLIANEQ